MCTQNTNIKTLQLNLYDLFDQDSLIPAQFGDYDLAIALHTVFGQKYAVLTPGVKIHFVSPNTYEVFDVNGNFVYKIVDHQFADDVANGCYGDLFL